jgi:hypothetical protein
MPHHCARLKESYPAPLHIIMPADVSKLGFQVDPPVHQFLSPCHQLIIISSLRDTLSVTNCRFLQSGWKVHKDCKSSTCDVADYKFGLDIPCRLGQPNYETPFLRIGATRFRVSDQGCHSNELELAIRGTCSTYKDLSRLGLFG